MIVKPIVSGATRKEAISRLKVALLNYRIKGIKTNIPMLVDVLNHGQFSLGETPTDFIEKYLA